MKGLLLIVLTMSGLIAGLPGHVLSSNSEPAGSRPLLNNTTSTTGLSSLPPGVGAYPLPDLSLPHTLVSNIEKMVGEGVIQTNGENLTLYNSRVALRLLGGHQPHDELLGPDFGVLSSSSLWGVEAYEGGVWNALLPSASNFTIIGTNNTGTYVVRTTQFDFGPNSGVLKTIYDATSDGPLRWDFMFDAGTAGHYRLTYTWNLTGASGLANPSATQFRASYGTRDYALSWIDVPTSLVTSASFLAGQFSLHVDLGTVPSRSEVQVDPSLVGSSTVPEATAYTAERKVFYEPKGGYYFVFYHNGTKEGYSYSHDGVSWSPLQSMPPGWGQWPRGSDTSTVFNSGQTVYVAEGTGLASVGGSVTASLKYSVGNINGPTISWGRVWTPANFSYNCGTYICIASIQNQSITVSSTGQPVFSFDQEFLIDTSSLQCVSNLYALYGINLLLIDSNSRCNPTGSGSYNIPSSIVPSDPNGKVRIVYEYDIPYNITTSLSWYVTSMRSMWYDGTHNGTIEQLDDRLTGSFSVVSDADFGVHIVYQGLGGNVTYAYRGAQDSSWTYAPNLFNIVLGREGYPTITADYTTNDVYVFAVKGSSIVGRSRPLTRSWTDTSIFYPVTNRNSPAYLGSNFASASNTNSTTIALIWTEGAGPPYNVTFASIPIQTVWSPYSAPSDPWDSSGLAPYGQYFASLGEYVSPSTGMLTILQTDLSVPGRGLNLDITRVYTEPYSFLNGTPYNFESYPWAPMGDSWQLNFPWMSNTPQPQYIHLRNGEGYRIPSSFWKGASAVVENHQGDNFRLARNLASITLFDKSGIAYAFDQGHRLITITDATGNNAIQINYINYYGNSLISNVNDTAGRVFLFCYAGGFLASIQQSGSSCGNGFVRRVLYATSGQNLISVTDPANRTTGYSYGANPWLLTRITFPTHWYDSYTYASTTLGTQTTTYRVFRQLVNATSGSPIRRVEFSYTRGAGDQVIASTVKGYDGAELSSETDYSFSFAGVAWNVSDANHNLVRGVEQRFGVNGEVPREVVLVTQGGSSSSVGSYTNYYSYDLWGNLIYSRRVINPSTNTYHESFNAYYNDGLPPGFNAFQETFSQLNDTLSDNPWLTYNGTWRVRNGSYNGTSPVFNPTHQESLFAWINFTSPNTSMMASIYVTKPMVSSDGRVGLIAHYPGNGVRKWALVLHNSTSGVTLSLLDEDVSWVAGTSCSINYNSWYRFNFTVSGFHAWGSASAPGVPLCRVSGSFWSNDIAKSTAFGLYAGGYSALFDNITVTTVAPGITGTSFSNSFFQSGAPNSNIHGLLAGSATLQTGAGSMPQENYYNYTLSGELSQTRQLYMPSSSGYNKWLTTVRTYDSYGNLANLTDPSGNQTLYAYSSKYKSAYLTSQNQTTVLGGTLVSRMYGYNFTMGTLLSSIDPNGGNTTYQYDILGRVRRVNYPNSLGFEAYRYNDTASFVDITNENGLQKRQVFDGLGRLLALESFLNGMPYSNTTYTYNWKDEVVTKTDQMGNVYNYYYDTLGQLTEEINPDKSYKTYSYDERDGLDLISDETGASKAIYYDRLGRVWRVGETSALGWYLTTYSFDEVGNLDQLTTSSSQSTVYNYDNLNRLSRTSYPDGTSEFYSYNSNGDLVAKADRNGLQTSYAYDSLGQVLRITYHGVTLTSDIYTYDKSGNLVQLHSQNATLTYSYDARNRVVSETYSVNQGTSGSDFSLSNSGGISAAQGGSGSNTVTAIFVNGTSRLVNLTCTSGLPYGAICSFNPGSGYPSFSSILTVNTLYSTPSGSYAISVTGTGGGKTYTTQFTLTVCKSLDKCPPGGNGSTPPTVAAMSAGYYFNYTYHGEALGSVTYSDLLTVNYAYDSLGRTLSVTPSGSLTPYASFTYYPNDQVQTITYGNGLISNYTYNSMTRPLNSALYKGNGNMISLTYAYTLPFTFTPTDMVTGVTGQINGAKVNEQYSYDPLRRLTSSTVTSGGTSTNLSYSYDSMGNRLSQNLNGTSTTYNYNQNNNELISSSSTSGPTLSYSYNGDGTLKTRSITAGGTTTRWTYAWDVPGNLLKVANDTGVQGYYAYDGLGRRVEASEGVSTTFYAYYGTETLAEQSAGGIATDYIFAQGLRIARVSGASINYYHTDPLGGTLLTADSNGNVSFSDNYQPFGQDNGTPTGSETYKFTGKPVSQTTGLYYYLHRWYDPTIGRFVSEDPFPGIRSDPQSLNGYAYASNSPTGATDPTGLTAYTSVSLHQALACPSVWKDPLGYFSCSLSHTPTPVADVVAGYDLAAWGIAECEEECGQLINGARAGAGTEATKSGTGPITITTDTTRIVTSDVSADTATEGSSPLLKLGSHLIERGHLGDIAGKFTGEEFNGEPSSVPEAVSMIKDTLYSGSFNPARSTESIQAFEKVYLGGPRPYGLRVLVDLSNGEVFDAYPFKAWATGAKYIYDSVPWPF